MDIKKVYISDEKGNVKEFRELDKAEAEQDSLRARGVRTIPVWYHDGWALLVTSGKP